MFDLLLFHVVFIFSANADLFWVLISLCFRGGINSVLPCGDIFLHEFPGTTTLCSLLMELLEIAPGKLYQLKNQVLSEVLLLFTCKGSFLIPSTSGNISSSSLTIIPFGTCDAV
ncbi:hypothetical protein SAY87_007094 [Trapa incisa]|uniref:Uncharacterized protein n=1 Tax=Trapa incisa TaxID=236973 RepID=A0AAN7K2A7_9MYRT|nr:hypothetical protein SAY87_007094 [Trapa incisa]